MIGAKDLAFSAHQPAELVSLHHRGTPLPALHVDRGVDTGWTFYTPTAQSAAIRSHRSWTRGIHRGFSSIFTGLNFIVTIHACARPAYWDRLPLFIWQLRHSLIMILGTRSSPSHRAGGGRAPSSILVSSIRAGRRPLLFSICVWFYSHPAVYIMILPSMGVVSELITCFSRKRIFVISSLRSRYRDRVIGFLVWAHTCFVAGISLYAAMIFCS